MRARSVVKRTLDALVSLLMIVLLSPVYLIIGVMVRVYLGQPVLFRHTRTGKRGR